MAANRPGGRETVHSGGTSGVHKTGSGLGTGKVGNTDHSGHMGSSGSSNRGTGRGTGRSSSGGVSKGLGGGSLGIIVVIAIVFFALKSCGGSSDILTTISGLSGLTGSSSSILSLLSSGTSYTTTDDDYTSASSTTVTSSTDKELVTTVASGSRDKYTSIIGNGKDTVTILVYMCGTDLESEYGMGSSDLSEMAKATIGSNVNVIVYTGGCKAWKTTGISSSVNQIYKVENGGLTCLEKDMGSKAMTEVSTLVEFLNYGKNNYSANRMCLIFWDHGGGSLSGYGYDEKFSSSSSMTLAGINSALKQAGIKFDFIGFDACLMATLENGLMLADYADYMIASEESEPGVGWYYTNWLTKLSANTSMPTIEIGKNIVDDFVEVCNKKCSGQKTTLSVVDLAELSNTVPSKLSAFASATADLIKNDDYEVVSEARGNTREFAQSSKIDQIDLIDFANNLGTDEAKALAKVLDSAVKYNRTSSSITNSYGISIYFPYKKASRVDSTVKIYDSIGMDSEYTKCIQEFASLETEGQVSGGSTNSVLSSLLSSYTSGTSSSGGSVDTILSMLSGLSSSSSSYSTSDGVATSVLSFLSGRSLSNEDAAAYLADNYFDADKLVWTSVNGKNVISLTEDQWALVQDIDLNVLYDDGEGYIDLGMDNVLDYDSEGNLIGDYDNSWLAINGQVVAYYRTSYSDGVTTGYIPALLNGSRVEIDITFDSANPAGYITGVTYVYANGETETNAKSMLGLESGDTLQFICDYYDYSGNYKDSYYLGDAITLGSTIEIANVTISDSDRLSATYCFTDIYQQKYWTPVIP